MTNIYGLLVQKKLPILILKYRELSLLSCSFRVYFIRGTMPYPQKKVAETHNLFTRRMPSASSERA